MPWIHALGWFGQGAYFGRSLLQWTASERAGRSVLPTWFWPLSVGGAVSLLSYALLRHDGVIALGQAINLFVYLRNLRLAAHPEARLGTGSLRLALAGLASLFLLCAGWSLHGNHAPWMQVGWLGQFLFLSRFPMQWWRAEQSGRVELDASFWWISLGGSSLLLLYALWRHDPVIACGQAVGLLGYGRNLVLLHRPLRTAEPHERSR